MLGADKLDLSEAGGHSHKWGVVGTNTVSDRQLHEMHQEPRKRVYPLDLQCHF